MIEKWQESVRQFIMLCQTHQVKMILVGGAAVNFYGYQRHSADIDFWIDSRKENLNLLHQVLKEMGYQIDSLPESVHRQEQNISLEFSLADFDVELITRFSVNKTFDEAYNDGLLGEIDGFPVVKFKVLSLEDLITSKIKSGRPKDLLDIQQLKEIQKH